MRQASLEPSSEHHGWSATMKKISRIVLIMVLDIYFMVRIMQLCNQRGSQVDNFEQHQSHTEEKLHGLL